ncbi:MAG: hypothetical protein Q8L24_00035 [bacterium]|nr:hypothetical protein [bacterium]
MEISVEQLAALLKPHGVKVKDCGRCFILETSGGAVEFLNEVTFPFTPAQPDSHFEIRKIEKPTAAPESDSPTSLDLSHRQVLNNIPVGGFKDLREEPPLEKSVWMPDNDC